jgi:uncharacterized lipoprotein YajG
VKKLQLISIVSAILLMGGCGFKGTAIEFAQPSSIYMGDKAFTKAFLQGVSDERADKNSLGFVKSKDGEILAPITTSQNMSQWFSVAFEKEMRAAGFAPVSKEDDADASYLFVIKKLNTEYVKNELTGKNLRLELDIDVKIKNKNGIVTKSFKYNEQKWSKPLFEGDALKGEIEPFIRESVASTVKGLVAQSKTK